MIALSDAPATARASDVDAFLAGAALTYRSRLTRARGDAERALAEDALTLLTDYRLSDIDARAFDGVLARMRRGRSPVTLLHATPRAVADDIAARWRAHRAAALRIHDA